MQPMMTVQEVAKILKIQDEGVRREVQRGNLAAHRIGRLYRFKAEDVADYLDETTVSG